MTNHEAIEVLKSILMANPQFYSNNRINEAVCKACEALEPDEEVNEFACPFCGDVTYTATDYIPRFCQECGRDMGFREAANGTDM